MIKSCREMEEKARKKVEAVMKRVHEKVEELMD